MGRMDKYEEPIDTSLSRTKKNEILYKDVYLNNTLVDISNIISEDNNEVVEEQTPVLELETLKYTEKNYDINKYLHEKRLMRVKDNLPRSLNEEIKKRDDEISQLISKIEQKEKEENLFNDLMPDDEYATIIEGNNELTNFVSNDVIDNYVMNKELDETNSFMDLDDTRIIEDKKKKNNSKSQTSKKKNELALIIFCSLALILIGIIVYVVIKIF